MIAFLLASVALTAAPQNTVEIVPVVENGDVYVDILASDYPIRQLMESLCRKVDLELRGFEDIENSPRVTVYLRHRPLNVAVEYALGAAGLSGIVGADRIDVSSQSPPFPTREHSLQAAEIMFLTSLQRAPGGLFAEESREQLAQIALLRSEPAKAARHYEILAENAEDGPLAERAHMQAGKLLVDIREWTRAMPHFQAVGDTKLDEFSPDDLVETVSIARRELARCILGRGESRRAFYMLRGLEKAVPPLDQRDAAERLVLMARAMLGMGDHVGALETLDRATQVGPQFIDEFESMDLRAQALEASGHAIEASVAWLHFSRDKSEEIAREALVRAAQAALSVEGEELGVIFLHKQAESRGVGDALLPYLNEARSRLGLDAHSFVDSTPAQRLRQAIQLAKTGEDKQAIMKFESLQREFRELSVSERIEYAMTFAPLLERRDGVSYAIDVLRDVVMTLESVENRSKLYLVAGEIYERNQRFEEAAAAYGGVL